jgi:hypothetical protein
VDERTYSLYGMKITFRGDVSTAMDRADLALKLMFQTKMINTNNLDIIQGGRKWADGTEVRVLRQHGLDSAQIYVPPKPLVPVPGKKRWVEQFIWPAFEVTDIDGNYVGIVICRGGGFEPPYEFVPEIQIPEGKLPEDLPDEPAGELPKERNWVGTTNHPDMIERLFEDLETAGIAELDTSNTRAWTYENFSTESLGAATTLYCGTSMTETHDNNENCVAHGYEPSIVAKFEHAAAFKLANRTQSENASVDVGFSYSLDGDPDLGDWDEVEISRIYYFGASEWRTPIPGQKPNRTINYDSGLGITQTGSGESSYVVRKAVSGWDCGRYCVEWYMETICLSMCWYLIEGVIESLKALALNTLPDYEEEGVLSIRDMTAGSHNVSYNVVEDNIWTDVFMGGSVFDPDNFCFIHMPYHEEYVVNYSAETDNAGYACGQGTLPGELSIDADWHYNYETTGKVEVVLDQASFTVREGGDYSGTVEEDWWDRLVKYFMVGDSRYGLYFQSMALDRYNQGFSYFVYGAKNPDGETKFFKTVINAGEPLADIKGLNDMSLYPDGSLDADGVRHNVFRLIRETVIYE